MTKYVYFFDEGRADMKALLGIKGANLAEMTHMGLPVPTGMTITTTACNDYYSSGKKWPEGLHDEVCFCLQAVEKKSDKKLGDKNHPLLVSVRSGAMFSMPGMMDAILNLGLNDQTVVALAKNTGNWQFAYDCYRRFIQMFGNAVLEIPKYSFEVVLAKQKEKQGVKLNQELTVGTLRLVIDNFKTLIKECSGQVFPEDPMEQLFMAVEAGFRSWNNARAIVYRNLNKISHDLGTAVNIQEMVFGNMGDDSGAGVVFSRNPSTGENVLYGEYLINAQGEEVVAGIRTPQPIARLDAEMPWIYRQFSEIMRQLERHYKNMQDIEFTVEKGKLYILQTRNGKRTAAASVRIAYEMVQSGILGKEEAIFLVAPGPFDQLLHRQMDDSVMY